MRRTAPERQLTHTFRTRAAAQIRAAQQLAAEQRASAAGGSGGGDAEALHEEGVAEVEVCEEPAAKKARLAREKRLARFACTPAAAPKPVEVSVDAEVRSSATRPLSYSTQHTHARRLLSLAR